MELMEIIFILAIFLLIFGPEKLPEMARELGKAIYEFRKASSGIVGSPSVTRNPTEISGALKDIAEKLKIRTEGKTIKQITREIIREIESKTVEK